MGREEGQVTEQEQQIFELMRDELDRQRALWQQFIEIHDPIGRIERVLDIAESVKPE